MEVNRQLNITGVVQGVGFRPFIYQLATRFYLNGFILNSSSGVSVEIEGEENAIEAFMEALKNELPPLARIDSLKCIPGKSIGYTSFQILQSKMQNDKSTLVSPDIAICENCLQEMNDPSNRRYDLSFYKLYRLWTTL